MKTKEELAAEMYPNPAGPFRVTMDGCIYRAHLRRAFIAGFDKARELAQMQLGEDDV